MTRAAAQELLTNGGFENGTTGWTIFIPAESETKGCTFDVVATSPHSGASCAHLHSDDFGRFGIGGNLIPVKSGEHYRVTAWVRAEIAAQVQPKTPGFVIRLNLLQGQVDAPGGHLYIEFGNTVSRGQAPTGSAASLPQEWTKVEAVVEIPAGVDSIGPSLFSWWVKGDFFVDDFSIQKVDASVPANSVANSNP